MPVNSTYRCERTTHARALKAHLYALTQEDAGADFSFEYPFPSSDDFNGWLADDTLLSEQLPDASWPAPQVGLLQGGIGQSTAHVCSS